MGKALIGIPYRNAIVGSTPAIASLPNQNNDEPGLVVTTPSVTTFDLTVDLGSAKTVSFVSLLGLSVVDYGTIQVFGGAAAGATTYTGPVNGLSFAQTAGNRSAVQGKAFYFIPSSPTYRYWTVRVTFPVATVLSFWDFLIGDTIQPGENITVGAEEGVDDRSVRRYLRNGRRVIDPTVVVPTFQGEWPWLTDAEFKEMRRWWRQYGASYPSLFVLDPDIVTTNPYGGEDGIYYGDFEKTAKFGYDDGCYSFSFAVVSIAP